MAERNRSSERNRESDSEKQGSKKSTRVLPEVTDPLVANLQAAKRVKDVARKEVAVATPAVSGTMIKVAHKRSIK
jgi:hypothetical protein